MQLKLNSPQLKRSGSQQKSELQLKSVAVGVGAEGEACLAAEATEAEEACLADEARRPAKHALQLEPRQQKRCALQQKPIAAENCDCS